MFALRRQQHTAGQASEARTCYVIQHSEPGSTGASPGSARKGREVECQ